MNTLRICIGVIGILALGQSARAQVPFFFPGANAFTPEISIVTTGAVTDVQAAVSADRKYVTLNMRAQNSTLLSLQSFTFQNGPLLGNVGDPPPKANANGVGRGRNGGAGSDPSTAVRSSPSDVLDHAKALTSVLHREGMTRISLLKPGT